MMTEPLQVSILAAPLGAIDRRALSQAWYSALRVVESGEQPTVAARRIARNGTPGRTREAIGEPAPRARGDASNVPAAVLRGRVPRAALAFAGAVAPRTRAPLSVQIERRFAGGRTHVKRATFTVGRGEARVHVILQTTGNRATLLALCRPEMQTAVARALTQARVALAERGIALDLAENRAARCS